MFGFKAGARAAGPCITCTLYPSCDCRLCSLDLCPSLGSRAHRDSFNGPGDESSDQDVSSVALLSSSSPQLPLMSAKITALRRFGCSHSWAELSFSAAGFRVAGNHQQELSTFYFGQPASDFSPGNTSNVQTCSDIDDFVTPLFLCPR